jgi:glycosyltransferase involved in cell wall biosynthesis
MQKTAMVTAQGAPAKLDVSSWPRIALVTPVLNSGKYIEQTIRSVLAQGYPNLDYFIVDGGSTDRTLNIIGKYESQISGWMSEPDSGMYDALNKGFARTSGEIMGWISATDMLHPGGLTAVGAIFRDLPGVEWITGRPSTFTEDGVTTRVDGVPHWSRWRFLAGANRHIQQESTYWRRSLWDRAGGRVDATRRWASDFELWVRFFRHARLYPADVLIGGFRANRDSLGLQNAEECLRVQDEIIEKELQGMVWGKAMKLMRATGRAVKGIPVARGIWRRLVTNSLYRLPGQDWPPTIRYFEKAYFE